MTRNERVPVKLSAFAKGVRRPPRRVIKDCLKFVACRTNFVRRWNSAPGRPGIIAVSRRSINQFREPIWNLRLRPGRFGATLSFRNSNFEIPQYMRGLSLKYYRVCHNVFQLISTLNKFLRTNDTFYSKKEGNRKKGKMEGKYIF